MTRPAGVAAVVLAAGAGTRFSGPDPKLLVAFRGRPLVAWAVAGALEAGLSPVVVVTGAFDLAEALAPLRCDDLVVVANPDWEAGQATSLRVGLAKAGEAGAHAAVVGLGDQPLVGADAWRAVAASDVAPVVTATFGGARRPPVRLARSVWPLLADRGDEGARELMRRRPDLVAEVACEGDPVDVDTAADLLRAEEAAGTPGGAD